MPRSAFVVLVIVVVLATAVRAHAQYRPVYAPPPSPTAPEPSDKVFLYLAGHAGIYLPIGGIGAELGIGLDWLRGGVSIGQGLRGSSVAAMVRAVRHVRGIDFALGAGVSRGPGIYEITWLGDDDPDDGYDAHFGAGTRWVDLELSGEVLMTRSSFVRFTAGASHAFGIRCIAVERGVGVEEPCTAAQFEQLDDAGLRPYFGFAVGVRFPSAAASRPRLGAAFARPVP